MAEECPAESSATDKPEPVYDPLLVSLMNRIEWAICEAWERLPNDPVARNALERGHEDDITISLGKELKLLRLVPGDDNPFNRNLFDPPELFPTVPHPKKFAEQDAAVDAEPRPEPSSTRSSRRASKVKPLNRQQQIPTNNPDLGFTITARTLSAEIRPLYDPIHDAYFVEAKVITGGSGINEYFSVRGLERFVDGRFAHRMQDALMLAYTFGNFDIHHRIENAFATGSNYDRLAVMQSAPYPVRESLLPTDPVHYSEHQRNKHKGHNNPVPIVVRHMWLNYVRR